MITFLDVAKQHNWPTQFRYIVLAETCSTDESERDPVTGLNITKVKTMYVAVALEWYIVAQGDTIEKAVEALKHLFMTQAAIKRQYPDSNDPRPSPEDYQRVATSGDWYICTDPKWAAVCRKRRVAKRGIIDMAQSTCYLVPKKA